MGQKMLERGVAAHETMDHIRPTDAIGAHEALSGAAAA
jgi:hypothetical protein